MKQQMKITKHAPVAEYRQIRKYVVDTVWESGNAPKRLASMRELAAMFNVSIATVQRALKELVDHIDPDAFVIVSDVREVHGEGFIERK